MSLDSHRGSRDAGESGEDGPSSASSYDDDEEEEGRQHSLQESADQLSAAADDLGAFSLVAELAVANASRRLGIGGFCLHSL